MANTLAAGNWDTVGLVVSPSAEDAILSDDNSLSLFSSLCNPELSEEVTQLVPVEDTTTLETDPELVVTWLVMATVWTLDTDTLALL